MKKQKENKHPVIDEEIKMKKREKITENLYHYLILIITLLMRYYYSYITDEKTKAQICERDSPSAHSLKLMMRTGAESRFLYQSGFWQERSGMFKLRNWRRI